MSAHENDKEKPAGEPDMPESPATDEHDDGGEAYGAYEAENFGPEGDNSKN